VWAKQGGGGGFFYKNFVKMGMGGKKL